MMDDLAESEKRRRERKWQKEKITSTLSCILAATIQPLIKADYS